MIRCALAAVALQLVAVALAATCGCGDGEEDVAPDAGVECGERGARCCPVDEPKALPCRPVFPGEVVACSAGVCR